GIQFMGLREVVKERYEKDLTPGFRKYLEAYVDGINSYAALHPKEVLLKKGFPIRPQDVVIGYLMGLVELSQARPHLEKIMSGKISADLNPDVPKGSNAIAISAKRTTDGKTYLAINSHQPLEGWYSWYEAHLISEEGLNILGGTFPGGATIFHGANQQLGWAHTVNHVDLSDVFHLEMHPENDLQYKLDDQWLDLEPVTYKAKVKLLGPLKIGVKRKIFKSKYGPTFKTDEGFFAWRFVAKQDIRAAEQWYRMNKAKSFEDFKAALKMQAIPSTNIVYADREDNIYYISNAKVPIRSEAYNWRKVVPGNTNETLWNSYYPIDSLPQVFNPNSGYVYNTNNTPFSSSAPADNPKETPANKTMTFQHPDMENSRSIRFQELIQQYKNLSYEDFKTIKYDQQYGSKVQSKEMQNLDLIFQLNPAQHPKIKSAIEQLQAWDRKCEVDNTTAPLFIISVQLLVQRLQFLDRYEWRGSINEEDAVSAIQRASNFLMENYGTLNVSLGDLQRHMRGEVSMPLGGGPDVLAAMYSQPVDGSSFLKGFAGESYIELVRFSSEGVEIESVNAYGSSEEPDSPHYTDQMELFVKQQLKPMTLDKKTVLEQAVKVYAPKQVLPRKSKRK
ncbi:MAG: penicillin acylase family protein, partial [Bacteroidota bacterium]